MGLGQAVSVFFGHTRKKWTTVLLGFTGYRTQKLATISEGLMPILMFCRSMKSSHSIVSGFHWYTWRRQIVVVKEINCKRSNFTLISKSRKSSPTVKLQASRWTWRFQLEQSSEQLPSPNSDWVGVRPCIIGTIVTFQVSTPPKHFPQP